jgi:enoyl-CoA hydratase/carnithine racemase
MAQRAASPPSTALVRVELTDGVAVLSFSRPERHNALNNAMSDEWHDAMRWAIGSVDVRCILLRGDGPSFSSGRDTAELGQREPGDSDFAFVRRSQEVRLETLDAPKPVVAALHGNVLGGAFEIALSADMRIAATSTRLGFPEVGFGLGPDTGGSQLLPPLIGPAKSKFLLMTGERIDARTALQWGIVDWLVEDGELDDAGLGLARRLAAAPPTAVAVIKQLVDHAWAGSIRDGIRHELVAQCALFAGEEHRTVKAARLAQSRAGTGRG